MRIDVIGRPADRAGRLHASSTSRGGLDAARPDPLDRAGRGRRATPWRSRPTSRTGCPGCCWSGCRTRRCARPGTGSGRRSSTAASSGRSAGSRSACHRPACPSGAAASTSASPWPSWRRPASSRRPPWTALVFLGELGLDGRLRPVPGVLPAMAAAAAAGFGRVGRAAGERGRGGAGTGPAGGRRAQPGRAARLAARRGRPAADAASRCGICRAARGGAGAGLAAAAGGSPRPAGHATWPMWSGQPAARRAAEICAAGGHHLLLLGPPGVGKTMLAERLPTSCRALDRRRRWRSPRSTRWRGRCRRAGR